MAFYSTADRSQVFENGIAIAPAFTSPNVVLSYQPLLLDVKSRYTSSRRRWMYHNPSAVRYLTSPRFNRVPINIGTTYERFKKLRVKEQYTYYKNYNVDHIPYDLFESIVLEEKEKEASLAEEESSRQGNILKAIYDTENQESVLLFPTGKIMQQVTFMPLGNSSKRTNTEEQEESSVRSKKVSNPWKRQKLFNICNHIETGTTIRQLEFLNNKTNMSLTETCPVILVRGAASVHALEFSYAHISQTSEKSNHLYENNEELNDNLPSLSLHLKTIHKERYKLSLLQNMHCNPFREGEVILMDIQGNVSLWSLLTENYRCLATAVNPECIESEQLWRHWMSISADTAVVGNYDRLYLCDTRDRLKMGQMTVLSEAGMYCDTILGTIFERIHNIQRHVSNEHMYQIATTSRIQLCDIRYNGCTPLTEWLIDDNELRSVNVPFDGVFECGEIEQFNGNDKTSILFLSSSVKAYSTAYPIKQATNSNIPYQKVVQTKPVLKDMYGQYYGADLPIKMDLYCEKSNVKVFGAVCFNGSDRHSLSLAQITNMGDIAIHTIQQANNMSNEESFQQQQKQPKENHLLAEEMGANNKLIELSAREVTNYELIQVDEIFKAFEYMNVFNKPQKAQQKETDNEENTPTEQIEECLTTLWDNLTANKDYFSITLTGLCDRLQNHMNTPVALTDLYDCVSTLADVDMINIYSMRPSSKHIYRLRQPKKNSKSNSASENHENTFVERYIFDCDCRSLSQVQRPCQSRQCLRANFLLVSTPSPETEEVLPISDSEEVDTENMLVNPIIIRELSQVFLDREALSEHLPSIG